MAAAATRSRAAREARQVVQYLLLEGEANVHVLHPRTLSRGYTSPDILVVVTSVFLGGDLPPRLPVRTVLCLPPANVPLIFLSRICT